MNHDRMEYDQYSFIVEYNTVITTLLSSCTIDLYIGICALYVFL